MKINQNFIIIGLILFAIALRIVPHPPNFTPIGAIGLFAGCYITVKRFWLVPIIGLLASDLIIGFYNPISMFYVYFSFIISSFIGYFFLKNKNTPLRLVSAALISAILFFIFSNLGVWLSGTIYSLDLSGLIACYLLAIPFFGNTLISELFYSLILFGSYYFFTQQIEKNQKFTFK
tara:strand:+ start:557 stop:1084 length:528 start_codon:yes stop_codon:yes gene_type:complete